MKKFLTNIIILFTAFILQAQNIEVEAFTDKKEYLIGEPIKLTLDLKRNIKVNVAWPFLVEKIGAFDIVKNGKIDTILTNNKANEILQMQIATYDSGNYIIPKIEFEYEGRNNKINKITTTEIPIRINTVAIDTSQNIKKIKPNLQVPLTWQERLPYIFGGIIALALLTALVLFIIKRKQKETEKIAVPILKPHQIAINKLTDLKEQQLWQSGKAKKYYSELTDILRNYIEGRFEINAMEMTSDEIGRAIKRKKEVTKGLYRNAINLFELADLVKFAKAFPGSRINDENFANVEDFVNATKQQTVIVAGEKTEAKNLTANSEKQTTHNTKSNNTFEGTTVLPNEKPKTHLDKFLKRKAEKEEKKKLQAQQLKNKTKFSSIFSLFKKKQK